MAAMPDNPAQASLPQKDHVGPIGDMACFAAIIIPVEGFAQANLRKKVQKLTRRFVY